MRMLAAAKTRASPNCQRARGKQSKQPRSGWSEQRRSGGRGESEFRSEFTRPNESQVISEEAFQARTVVET
jgi:hypothetical protein